MDARIYVMADFDGDIKHKVGVSKNPSARSNELGTRVVWASGVVRHAEEAECVAHKMLWSAGKQIACEWFNASADECVAAVDLAIKVVNGDADWPDRLTIRGNSKRGFWRETPRQNITIRADAVLLAAIDDIRAMTRPIPTVVDVIRVAIAEHHDALKRKMAAQERRE